MRSPGPSSATERLDHRHDDRRTSCPSGEVTADHGGAREQGSERGPVASPSPERRASHHEKEADHQDTSDLRPDAEQVEAMRARRLLELAGVHMRQALAFPDDVANLRTLIAELLLENGMLRLDVQRLSGRVDRLERRVGR